MKPDDRVRLQQVVDALNAAIRFTQGRHRDDLDNDRMLSFALAHAVEIVGEAGTRISTQTRRRDPEIPWQDIIRMRDRLVHAYYDVDHDMLWSTATQAAPEMLARVKALLDLD